MSKTLVLCVDRDNDLGRKTEIKSPVIGREANLKAAEKLALADPEDSDVNCMFSAIATHDKIEDSEIATICGDVNIGVISDKKIAEELDEVLSKVKPDSVILISDGAEDEYIIPIIESRIKIDGIKRVVVKQSKTLEGAYYLLTKFMEDEKLQKKFMLPLSIVLIVWGLAALFGSISIGSSAIILVLGLYLFGRVFHFEKYLSKAGKEVVAGLKSGRLTVVAAILSTFIITIAILSTKKVIASGDAKQIVEGINEILIWVIVALLLVPAGRFVDAYFKERRVLWQYVIIPFSLISIGLIFSASMTVIFEILSEESISTVINKLAFSLPFITKIVGAILIAFIGMMLYHIVEDIYRGRE